MSTDKNSMALSVGFGLFSGAASSVLLQPFDRIKTIRQQLDKSSSFNSFSLAKKVVRERGPFELWKGTFPSVIRAAPGVSFHLSVVTYLRLIFKVRDTDARGLFLTGFITRVLIGTTLQPITMVKARLESSVYKERTMVGAIRRVVNETGVKGLWRGLLPTLLRDAPYSGLYLAFYRRLLTVCEGYEVASEDISPYTRFTCGAVAGLFACLLTQPFDVVKTIVQLYPKRSGSTFQTVVGLFKEHGPSVFLRGFALRATKRTLAAAMSWTIFDGGLSYFKRTYPHRFT